jgi:uncharacterized protein YkwD
MKKTISLLLTISLIFSFASAQEVWTYDMYKTTDYTNFRSQDIFHQSFDRDEPDIPLLNAAMFFLTNEQRVKHNKSAAEYHPALEIAAYNHSKRMAKTEFSHTGTDADRKTPRQRGELAGIANPKLAENIAYSHIGGGLTYLDLADKVITQWMNSPGHRSNILSDETHQMACGAYVKDSYVYSTQNFQWFYKIEEQKAKDKLPPLKKIK